jgi:hypothetical protein
MQRLLSIVASDRAPVQRSSIMRRSNFGKWMLAMFVMASLVVPGVVGAQQQPVASPAAAASESSEDVADDSQIEAAADDSQIEAAAGMCFNRVCTSHSQCRTWCLEQSAYCSPVGAPPHYKYCQLP